MSAFFKFTGTMGRAVTGEILVLVSEKRTIPYYAAYMSPKPYPSSSLLESLIFADLWPTKSDMDVVGGRGLCVKVSYTNVSYTAALTCSYNG